MRDVGTVINLWQLATQQNMFRLINDTYDQEVSAVSINKKPAEEFRKLQSSTKRCS